MEQYGIRMAFFVNAGENGKKVLKWVVGKKMGGEGLGGKWRWGK